MSILIVFRKLEVNMPRFKMERGYSLHNILPEMGMTSLFTDVANLARLSKAGGLRVSEVSLHFIFSATY